MGNLAHSRQQVGIDGPGKLTANVALYNQPLYALIMPSLSLLESVVFTQSSSGDQIQ